MLWQTAKAELRTRQVLEARRGCSANDHVVQCGNPCPTAMYLCIAPNYVCCACPLPPSPLCSGTCSHWRQRRVRFNCCLLRFFVAASTCCCCCCCVWQGSWHSSREDTPHQPPWPLLPSTPLFSSAWCTPWLICLIDAPLNIAYTYYRWPLAVALHLKCFR